MAEATTTGIDPRPVRSGRPVARYVYVVAAIGTVLVRLPQALRRGELGFDDGVYGASAMAMRDGAAPFVDIFCGQGPLYLPLLRIADLAGLEATWAPRLLGVVAAAVLVVVAGLLVAAGRRTAAVVTAMALVATSGLLFQTTTAIEADSVAASLAAVVVLLALRRAPPWAVGLAAAAALSVKSLLAVPAVLAAATVYVIATGWRPTGRAAGVAAAAGVALALPWGIGRVWDQSGDFHLEAREGWPIGANLEHLWDGMWRSERLLVVAASVVVAGLVVSWARRPATRVPIPEDEPSGSRDLTGLVAWLWLGGTVVILAIHSPLFSHHATMLVAPAAVLVARARPWWPALAVVGVVLLPAHLDRIDWDIDRSPSAAQAAAIADLRRLVPVDGAVITDGPGLVWWAGRPQLPSLIDLSLVRIGTGRVGAADVEAAAASPGVCAVLVWTSRLAGLEPLDLDGYEVVARYGEGQALWLRAGCGTAPPSPDDGGG